MDDIGGSALVVGGVFGMGPETARELASRGAHRVVIGSNIKLARPLTKHASGIEFMHGDVTPTGSVSAARDRGPAKATLRRRMSRQMRV